MVNTDINVRAKNPFTPVEAKEEGNYIARAVQDWHHAIVLQLELCAPTSPVVKMKNTSITSRDPTMRLR